jgi:DNA repair protein RecO (recombination protein O)
MIVRTDAIVLRAIDYSEASQIVTLYTREHGKTTVMARGARRTKSRFGSTLQPMSYVQVVYYHSPGRTLHTLKENAHVRVFHDIGRQMVKISVGLRVVELVRALVDDEQQNVLIFNLLLHTLARLDDAGERAANLLPYFQLRLASLLGFAPDVRREDVMALSEEGGLLLVETGAVMPAGSFASSALRASRAALRAFAVFARADVEDVMRINLEPDVRAETEHMADAFLRHHTGDAYPYRAGKVIDRISGTDRG